MPFVYRDDGLMVGWDKNLPRKQLSVEVWQILIDGKKPKRLPGSQDDKIVVETVETETVPLVKAVASNDLKAVTALLAQGADANVKNSVEIPVLVMAIRRGSAPMVEALLKNRADPNVRDVDTDLTPLLEALGRTHRADIVKMLLAAGADVNAASRKEGDSPDGHDAPDGCGSRTEARTSFSSYLTKAQTSMRRRQSGFTALSMAKESGTRSDHKGVIRKLEAAGAKK